ncbi:MAG: mandelate racemase/muconate lactonizing enzyme family protein [Betaproteobacteria bacterium]|nr:mandelate racemase/muconate lactonizing enzyme family protein [Betaproteobacteria bacterium]MDH5221940.1 mandelate racemase/muconate lactonizing enzyme family protein [Betaproteobacteria bacterium]MDH5351285.1 mandelate racemase/muconate lactonizing enzyme family protein [Betaproteobacteria bacterium]
MPADLRIADLKAYPTSFPVPPAHRVALGIGTAIKRDAVVVKVTTASGLVGWGESHHGRAHTAVAKLIDTTLRQLVLGMDAADVVGVWKKIYDKQLASHGMGAGTCLAMSGIDMALWDIRGKAAGMPLYRLLGGARRGIPAYAGGVSLGYQPPAQLIEELGKSLDAGYRAVKLRVGDSVKRDLERVRAVRKACGEELVILTDANIGYAVEDVRQVMPGMDELNVSWLEEPFPAHDYRSYRMARGFGRTPLAAGENHYTRFEFNRVIEDGAITILQPDLSKTGGITEALRIAAMASAWKLPIHPHSSMTGLNHAATIHFLAAIDNGGYFEGDVSKSNRFRDELVQNPGMVDKDGNVWPLDKPGLGVEVNEDFLAKHPAIEGPGYI